MRYERRKGNKEGKGIVKGFGKPESGVSAGGAKKGVEKDVLLIYPSTNPGTRPKYALPPLGVLYICAHLNKHGISAQVIDGEKDGFTDKDILRLISAKKPRIVGVSVMTPAIASAMGLIKRIRKTFEDAKVIVGGSHVSSTREELMEVSDDIDFAIYKEAETSFLMLSRHILNGEGKLSDIPGLIYKAKADGPGKAKAKAADKVGKQSNNIKSGKGIIVNAPRTCEDVDSLSFPELDQVYGYRTGDYSIPYSNTKKVTSLIISRGCPFSCAFCDAFSTHGKKLRLRKTDRVIDEIRYNMRKYGIKYFVFKDSTLTINKRWAAELCHEIIKQRLDIQWRCNTRVDCVDMKLLRLMKRAGCKYIQYGVESGSQKVLDRLSKGINIPQIIKAFRMTRAAGIRTYASFMFGSPGETVADIKKTIRLSQKINPDLAQFFVTIAYPGTKLYNDAIAEGLLPDPKWYLRELESADAKKGQNSIFTHTDAGFLKHDYDANHYSRLAYRKYYFRPRYFLIALNNLIEEPSFIVNIVKSVPILIRTVIGSKGK